MNESLCKSHEKLASAEAERGHLRKTISVSGWQGSRLAGQQAAAGEAEDEQQLTRLRPFTLTPVLQVKDQELANQAAKLAAAQEQIEALEADVNKKTNMLKGISEASWGCSGRLRGRAGAGIMLLAAMLGILRSIFPSCPFLATTGGRTRGGQH